MSKFCVRSRGAGMAQWWERSTRLPPMCLGFDSPTRRHMRVEFVVGSLLCSERFFSGTPVFPSPQKPTLPNSNSTLEKCPQLVRKHTQIKVIYLFILLIYFCPLQLEFIPVATRKISTPPSPSQGYPQYPFIHVGGERSRPAFEPRPLNLSPPRSTSGYRV